MLVGLHRKRPSDRHLVALVLCHECHPRLHRSPVRIRPGRQAC